MAVTYSSYNFEIDTGWFSFAGFGGYQRFYELLLLGQAISEHTLRIKTAYDFDPRWTDDQTFYSSEVGQYFDNSALYAMSSAAAYADKAYLLSVATSRGKCTAIRFNISDYFTDGLSTLNDDGTTDTTLVALYKMNEALASSSALDAAGGGFTLTSYASPAVVTAGRYGGARSFFGGARYFWRSDSAGASPFELLTPTISFWLSFTGNGTANNAGIFDMIRTADGVSVIKAYITQPTNLLKVNVLLGASTITLTSTSTFSTTWKHVVVTYSGQTVNLHVSGVLEATYTAAAPTDLYYGDDSVNLYVGIEYIDAGHYLNGAIDELAFYNTVKSASWITATANMPSSAINSYSLSGLGFCVGNKRQLANAGDARKV